MFGRVKWEVNVVLDLTRCSELSLGVNGADGPDSQGPNLGMTPISKTHLGPSLANHTAKYVLC